MEVKLVEMKFCDTEIPKEFHEFDVITDVETKISFLRRDCFDRLIQKFVHEKELVWVKSPAIPKLKGEYLCIVKRYYAQDSPSLSQQILNFDKRWFGINTDQQEVTHFTKLVYPKID
jgi:hypothetical protein